jgi:hypothetical protein
LGFWGFFCLFFFGAEIKPRASHMLAVLSSCTTELHPSPLQVFLKPTITYGKGEPGDSHPIIDEWGGAGMVPHQVKVVLEPKHGYSKMSIFL